MTTPHPDLTLRKPGRRAATPGGTDLFTVCRNEAKLLPAFLDHYRGLGVERFYVIDNASTDATAEVLSGMEDVWHFHTTAHYYSANDGCDWVRAVVAAEAPERWGIFADVDELLVYPGCEGMPLPVLTRAMDEDGAEGLYAFMLDFYSPRLFDATPYEPGTPFTTAHPHFDGAGYTAGQTPQDRSRPDVSPDLYIRGGVRHRLIDWSHAGKLPTLRKVPLARATGGVPPWTGSHTVTRRRLFPITGALLHFKFLSKSDTSLRADVEANGRGIHQPVYETYLKLYEDGAPDPMHPEFTQTWRDSLQLVELGLCALPKSTLRPVRQSFRQSHTRAQRQPTIHAMAAAAEVAEQRFKPSPGHVFQTLHTY